MQMFIRSGLENYFDVIFKGTIAALGLALLVSGVWLELRRARSRKEHATPSTTHFRKLALKRITLAAICGALYYFGLVYAMCSNPAQGVRIIEFIHLFEYSLITIIILKAVSGSIRGHAAYAVVFLVMYLVGLGDEAIQGHIARRVGEFRDVRINAIVIGLAILSIGLVFSPRSLSGRLTRKHVRSIMLLAGICVIATAAFILHFHIGHRIEDDRCGAFHSLYTREYLLKRSRGTVLGPLPPRGGTPASAAIRGYWAAEDFYETEAYKHLAEREKLRRQELFWEAFCEEQTRRIYYAPFADLGEWKDWTAQRMCEQFGEYDRAAFVSYHHDLVFPGWESWHVILGAFVACIPLLIVGIFFGGTRGTYADI